MNGGKGVEAPFLRLFWAIFAACSLCVFLRDLDVVVSSLILFLLRYVEVLWCGYHMPWSLLLEVCVR